MPCAVRFFVLMSNRSSSRSLIRSCVHAFIHPRIKRLFYLSYQTDVCDCQTLVCNV